MKRLLLLLTMVLLQACSSASKPFVLPQTAPGGWRLTQTKYDGAKTLGVYEGAGVVRVEVEDTGAQAVAFERVQRARPRPDTVFFDRDRYFITVSWEQADRDALKQLVRELQKRP